MVALGNAMKLPGLRKYLEQNLGYDVVKVESFRGLVGSSVIIGAGVPGEPRLFRRLLRFGDPGAGQRRGPHESLALPVGRGAVDSPQKPWGLGVAAMLLLGVTVSFASFARALGTVDKKMFRAGRILGDDRAIGCQSLENRGG